MGSNQFGSRSGNGHGNLSKSINISSLKDYCLEDLKSFEVKRIQFGTNPLSDSIILGENKNNGQIDNYSAPPVIGFHQGIPGILADIVGIGKNNCVHCFCFLEVDELADNEEGIITEFGEYNYGDPNDFNVQTLYASRKGGLRFYVVKTKWFENYCSLARVKCEINKKEILEDILVGISRNYKWRLEFYDRKKQNCQDYAAELLNYLDVQSYEICKGTIDNIPDKIRKVLKMEVN